MVLDKEKDYADIMTIIDSMEGHKFEILCAAILKNNGFRDVVVTRGSGDYGIDITARFHNRIYGIQCKRYANTVGINAVRDALGGYDYYNCDIVAVLTNSTFTPQAINQANISGVKLWDRKSLLEFIDNCENLDFVKDFYKEDSISEETVFKQSSKYKYNHSLEKVKIKNYTVQNGGIYISNKKCSRTFVNFFQAFCLVSGIIICFLSLLIFVITPLLGIIFLLFGIYFVMYSRKLKKVVQLYDSQCAKQK